MHPIHPKFTPRIHPLPAASVSGLFSFPASRETMQAGASLVTLELLFSLFVRCSRSAGSTALNQGMCFRPCVAFRSKGVSVSFTPFCASEYRNGTRDTNHTYPEPQLFSTAFFGHDFRDHALCVPIFCIGRVSRPFTHFSFLAPANIPVFCR